VCPHPLYGVKWVRGWLAERLQAYEVKVLRPTFMSGPTSPHSPRQTRRRRILLEFTPNPAGILQRLSSSLCLVHSLVRVVHYPLAISILPSFAFPNHPNPQYQLSMGEVTSAYNVLVSGAGPFHSHQTFM
jgi:hypothetical protein